MKTILLVSYLLLSILSFSQEAETPHDFKLNGNVKSAETRLQITSDHLSDEGISALKQELVALNLLFSDIRQFGGKGVLTLYEDIFVEGKTSFNEQYKVTEIQVFSNGKFNNKMTYFFDSEGKRTHKHRTGVNGQLAQRGVYRYNTKNQLIEEVYYDANDKEEVRQKYRYDKQGKLTNRYMDSQNNWSMTEEIDYQGDKISERTIYLATGDINSFISYQYDVKGNLTQIDFFSPQLSYISTFTYDSDNRLLTEKSRGSEFHSMEVRFNPQGWAEHIEIVQADTQKTTLTIDFDYIFDAHHNWTTLKASVKENDNNFEIKVLRTIEYY